MKFKITYHQKVVSEDIPLIPKRERSTIKNAIESRLTTKPEHYGKPLRRSLKGYRKLRVGDYRIVFRINRQVVKIFVIQHRRVVYDNAFKRVDR